MSAVKVLREIKSAKDAGDVSQLADGKSSKDAGDASQPADGKPAQQFVSLVIVHAADQPWSEAPSKAALDKVTKSELMTKLCLDADISVQHLVVKHVDTRAFSGSLMRTYRPVLRRGQGKKPESKKFAAPQLRAR